MSACSGSSGSSGSSSSSSSSSSEFAGLAGPRCVCVIGAGAFGTAMAVVAATNGHTVKLYARDPLQVDAINTSHRNPRYLSEFDLPVSLVATANPGEAMRGASLIISALPAQRTPEWIVRHRAEIPENAVFCSTAKGLYLPTKQLLSAAMLEAFGRPQKLAFLSGPSFAKQIMQGHPTAVVVASAMLADAVAVQFALSNRRFRVYSSQDTIGVELGGALKNPLALGAGMIEGKGYGINTMAAYVTRAARELTVLCVAYGGKPETIAGLAGVGDLMLTAFGDLSRNRDCGLRLSRGEKLDDILSKATVEGVPTAQVAIEFAARANLDLPIFQTIQAILAGTVAPDKALELIMSRPLGSE